MPSPHPDNDLIDENDLIAQDITFENDKITNISERNADVIEHEEDVCDEDCGGSKIGIGFSGDSSTTVNWFAWNCDKTNKTFIRDECNNLTRTGDCLKPNLNIRDDCQRHVP
ncbi:hypothetical protein Hanom_Chr08g00716571 [Helianthus anomalus]